MESIVLSVAKAGAEGTVKVSYVAVRPYLTIELAAYSQKHRLHSADALSYEEWSSCTPSCIKC